jgi:hypothetical protein
MVLLEHFLLAMKLLLSHLIEELPRWVQEKKAQEAERLRKQLAVERLAGYKYALFCVPLPALTPLSSSLLCLSLVRIQDPPSEDSTDLHSHLERNAVASKISELTSSSFGYSPTLLLSLVSGPVWLKFLGLPMSLYGPLSMGLLAYIKADKDKQDNSSARGVTSDPNVSPSLSHLSSDSLPRFRPSVDPQVSGARAARLDPPFRQ